MSLRQWFVRKFPLNNTKKRGLTANIAAGSSTITPELSKESLHRHLRIGVIAIISALFIVPAVLLFPQIRQWVRATTWQTPVAFDSAGNVGLYASTILNSSGLPATVYYDKTNFTTKFAQRSALGVWAVENVEVFGADYASGINSDKNTKFGIALDPSDSKMSVAYCDYAAGGGPNQSILRFAHRVGNGSGNCGTSSNWQCSNTAIAYNTACAMRMISLDYATTSSLPTMAYVQGDTLQYNEYDGAGWVATTVVASNAGLVFDQNQTVLKYLDNGAPIIFFVQNDGVATNAVKYTYRSVVDWTWSAPATILTAPWNNVSVEPYAVSVTKDVITANLFYIAAGLNSDLRYATLNSSFVVGAVTVVDTGTLTWNSIMLQASGNPAIGYYDSTGGALKYAAYDGAAWVTESVAAAMGEYVGLVPNAGDSYPNMSVYDGGNGNVVYVTQNNAPTAPTVLFVSTSTAQLVGADPVQVATTTPVFSAKFQDIDSGDISVKAQIQVTTAADGFLTVNKWDSGATVFAPAVARDARSIDFKYGAFGNAPSNSLALGDNGFVSSGVDTSYYWRIRFWDQSDVPGAWSATGTFTLLDRPAAPTNLTLSIPYPYTTGANIATLTKDILFPDVSDEIELTISAADGLLYTHLASSTVNHSLPTDTVSIPTDVFALDTRYLIRAHNYNILGVSNETSEVSFNAFREPTASLVSSSCSSLTMTGVDPHFSGSSSFLFQFHDDLGNSYFDTSPSSERTVTGLIPGSPYTYTLYITPDDLRYSTVVYGQSTLTGRLLACDLDITATQLTPTSAQVTWGNSGSDPGVYYIVKNATNDEQHTVLENSPHSQVFSGLEMNHSYTFTLQSYNVDDVTSGNIQTNVFQMAKTSFSAPTVSDYPATGMFTVYQQGIPSGYALSEDVLLDITSASAGWMKISNSPDFSGVAWLTVPMNMINKYPWKLSGVNPGEKSVHTIYLKFLNLTGLQESTVYNQPIIVDQNGIKPPKILFPADGIVSPTGKLLFSGTAESGVTVRLSAVNAGTAIIIGETVVKQDGTWAISTTQELSAGWHTIEAVAINVHGSVSIPYKIYISVNPSVKPAPQSPVVEFPKQGSVVTSQSVTTHGFSEPYAHIVIKNYAGNTQDIDTVMTEADATGKWSVALPTMLGLGVHSYSYYAKDELGATSIPNVIKFVVDLNPLVPIEPLMPVLVDDPKPKPELLLSAKEPPIAPILVSHNKDPEPPIGVPQQNINAPTGGTDPSMPIVSSEILSTPTQIIPEDKKKEPNFVEAAIAFFNPGTTESTSAEVVQKISVQTKQAVKQTVKSVQKTVAVARIVADIPEVQIANKAVVVPTAAVVGVASVSTAANIPQTVLYLRFLFTQPFALLNRRRRKQWGMVYNAITKMPIDLAVVRLIETEHNRIVQSKVTDQAGRYQFLAQPGTYRVEITKADFNFPPLYLKNKSEDGTIPDIYTGGIITLEKTGPISFNLPLDPVGVQKSVKQVLKESAKKRLAEILSMTGVIVTGISFVVTPSLLIGSFLVVHVGSFFLFRRLALGKRPKGWGVITDMTNKSAVERAVVRIFDTQYNKLLETQVTDSKGHYGFLVGKNEYYVMAEHAGHDKFTSNTVAVKNEKEGGVVGFDIALTQEHVDIEKKSGVEAASFVPAIEQQNVQTEGALYLPKELIPSLEKQEGLHRTLVKQVDTPNDKAATIKLHIPEAQDVLVFTRVAATASIKAKANVPEYLSPTKQAVGMEKLLLPVSFGSRNMVITGFEKKIDHMSEIISDGNFLSAIDKKN